MESPREPDDLLELAAAADLKRAQLVLQATPYRVSQHGADGTSPLMVAAWHGNREMAALLLSHKAAVNDRDPGASRPF